MTDQIYYKIQYPLKKAIGTIKKVDIEDPIPDDYSEEDIQEIKSFLDKWEQDGRKEIKSFIKRLKEYNE